jgi:hypothetical protein
MCIAPYLNEPNYALFSTNIPTMTYKYSLDAENLDKGPLIVL